MSFSSQAWQLNRRLRPPLQSEEGKLMTRASRIALYKQLGMAVLAVTAIAPSFPAQAQYRPRPGYYHRPPPPPPRYHDRRGGGNGGALVAGALLGVVAGAVIANSAASAAQPPPAVVYTTPPPPPPPGVVY